MTRSDTATRKDGYNRLLHAIVFAIAMLSISLHGSMSRVAQAAIVVTSNDRQIVAETNLEQPGKTRATSYKRPPRRLRFRHVDRNPIERRIKQEKHYEQ